MHALPSSTSSFTHTHTGAHANPPPLSAPTPSHTPTRGQGRLHSDEARLPAHQLDQSNAAQVGHSLHLQSASTCACGCVRMCVCMYVCVRMCVCVRQVLRILEVHSVQNACIRKSVMRYSCHEGGWVALRHRPPRHPQPPLPHTSCQAHTSRAHTHHLGTHLCSHQCALCLLHRALEPKRLVNLWDGRTGSVCSEWEDEVRWGGPAQRCAAQALGRLVGLSAPLPPSLPPPLPPAF